MTGFDAGRRAATLSMLLLATRRFAHAGSDGFASGPIRVMVPSSAGSGTDTSVRAATQWIGRRHGWTFVIENRAGANGFIGAQQFALAPAGGPLVFGGSSSTITSNPVMFKKLPYDPIRDFMPVARALVTPHAMLVGPKSSANTVGDFVKAARGGRDLAYASSGANRGTTERFLQEAGIRALHVPYKSSPPAIIDLIAGHIDFMFVDAVAAIPQARGGSVKLLAFTSTKRLKSMPAVPTMIESGFPGFEMGAWTGYFVKPGTPAQHVATLAAAIDEYYTSPEGQAFVESGGSYYEKLSPGAFAAWIEKEIALNRAIYRRAGIEPE